MDREVSYKNLLFISLILAAILGTSIYDSVLNTRPRTSMGRVPASVLPASQSETDQVSASKFELLAINCDSPTELQRTTRAKWLRVSAKNCPESDNNAGLINQSNGYQATLFEAKPGLLTSDLIPLQAGENRLQLSWQNRGKSLARSLRILRINRSN